MPQLRVALGDDPVERIDPELGENIHVREFRWHLCRVPRGQQLAQPPADGRIDLPSKQFVAPVGPANGGMGEGRDARVPIQVDHARNGTRRQRPSEAKRVSLADDPTYVRDPLLLHAKLRQRPLDDERNAPPPLLPRSRSRHHLQATPRKAAHQAQRCPSPPGSRRSLP